ERLAVRRHGVREGPDDRTGLGVAEGRAFVEDRDALDAARKVGLPVDAADLVLPVGGIGTGLVLLAHFLALPGQLALGVAIACAAFVRQALIRVEIACLPEGLMSLHSELVVAVRDVVVRVVGAFGQTVVSKIDVGITGMA